MNLSLPLPPPYLRLCVLESAPPPLWRGATAMEIVAAYDELRHRDHVVVYSGTKDALRDRLRAAVTEALPRQATMTDASRAAAELTWRAMLGVLGLTTEGTSPVPDLIGSAEPDGLNCDGA